MTSITRRILVAGLVTPAPLLAQTNDIQSVRIAVRAQVGTETFACGRQYPNVGSARSTIEGTEFKFFVHDVKLVAADGREVNVTLTQDELWQNGDVALLDFEDGSGGCANGNRETHAAIEGTVPRGEYRGLRFTMGVPFARNHLDLASQPSPLSLTRMFWAWNSGYKFLRLDLKTNGAQNWMVHLGSAECTPAGAASVVPTQCQRPNRVAVALNDFDPTRDAVVFDIAELLRDADVSRNQPKSASGCMSGPADMDCTSLFVALGLPHAASPAGVQRVFTVARGVTSAGGYH
jgi:uncharacterized repeat protein (TIGR04052 family)